QYFTARAIRASRMQTFTVSRDELEKKNVSSLENIAGKYGSSVGVNCEAQVNGLETMSLPLGDINVKDIEFVEFAVSTNAAGPMVAGAPRGSSSGVFTPIGPRPPRVTGAGAGGGGCGDLTVIVWMRQDARR